MTISDLILLPVSVSFLGGYLGSLLNRRRILGLLVIIFFLFIFGFFSLLCYDHIRSDSFASISFFSWWIFGFASKSKTDSWFIGHYILLVHFWILFITLL